MTDNLSGRDRQIAYYDDDAVLDWLRDVALEADPVPSFVVEAAQAAYTLRRLDAELAELVRDSLDEDNLVTVRGPGLTEVRLLSFEAGPLTVELQVSERAGGRHLVGHVSGIDLTAAELETVDGMQSVETDDSVLVVDAVPAGRVRLHLSAVDGQTYVTSWVLV